MSRLIDKDSVIDILFKQCKDEPKHKRTILRTLERINQLPTVDAVPVVHGHWTCSCIDKYELSYGAYGYIPQLMCSFCGRTADSYMRYDEPIMPEDMDGWRYCPNCGARMDGGIEDE